MSGERQLARLLAGLRPELAPETHVFATVPGTRVPEQLRPFASVVEDEGLTVVLTQEQADAAGLAYDHLAARITLRVHSDLAAVGRTAAVSTTLAAAGISCNVIAGHHHDHLFVPQDRAGEALELLGRLARSGPAPETDLPR